MAEFVSEVVNGMAPLGASTTLGRYLDKWLEHIAPRRSPTTIRGYRSKIKRITALMLGRGQVDSDLCNLDVSPLPREAYSSPVSVCGPSGRGPIGIHLGAGASIASPGLSYLGIRMVVDAVDLVRSRFALRTIRDRSANLGFPLDRKMAMLATNQRLVIWRASRQVLRAPVLLGEVERERIASARLPFIGGGWRVVEVYLVDGNGVRFLADGRSAEQFAAVLRGQG